MFGHLAWAENAQHESNGSELERETAMIAACRRWLPQAPEGAGRVDNGRRNFAYRRAAVSRVRGELAVAAPPDGWAKSLSLWGSF